MLAATSVPSALDPAVRRPGRFDREIELGTSSLATQQPLSRFTPSLLLLVTSSIPYHPSLTAPRIIEPFAGVPGEAARASILRVLLSQAGPMAAHLLPPPETPNLPEGSVTEVSEGGVACGGVIESIASKAHGFVGGDLLLLCKEAALEAMRRRVRQLEQSPFSSSSV